MMSGESRYARELVAEALRQAKMSTEMDADAVGRAILQAVIEQYREYREVSDIIGELDYLRDSLDDEDVVITRGC